MLDIGGYSEFLEDPTGLWRFSFGCNRRITSGELWKLITMTIKKIEFFNYFWLSSTLVFRFKVIVEIQPKISIQSKAMHVDEMKAE